MRERLAEDVGKWSALMVAVADDRVIGMLALYPGKLDQLFLAPEHKGIGVGEALFTEAKRLMPDGFTLWANSANDRARAFYERHGMTLVELGPRPDKPEQIVAHYRWTPA